MDYSNTATPSTAEFNPVSAIILLVFIVATIAGYWKMFEKAGKPGWAVIIPIYNLYVLLKVVGRPGWWIILYLIPLVNIVISLIVALDLAKVFGKGTLFGIVLNWLFQPIGAIILGFGKAKYKK